MIGMTASAQASGRARLQAAAPASVAPSRAGASAQTAGSAAPRSTSRPTSGDRVELSARARSLAAGDTAAASSPGRDDGVYGLDRRMLRDFSARRQFAATSSGQQSSATALAPAPASAASPASANAGRATSGASKEAAGQTQAHAQLQAPAGEADAKGLEGAKDSIGKAGAPGQTGQAAEAGAEVDGDGGKKAGDAQNPRGADGEPLSDDEARLLRELEQTDAEVRQHEQAHIAAGGAYVTHGARYEYRQGPDGQRYAVGGEVGIDVSPDSKPEQTIRKMQTVRAAALAPSQPSSQDRSVAASASQQESQARMEMRAAQSEESRESQARLSTAATDPSNSSASPSAAGAGKDPAQSLRDMAASLAS